MAAPKLSQLIRAELAGSQGIEVPCGLGCGKLTRQWMQVVVTGAAVTMEPLKGHQDAPEQGKPSLDLRICAPCFAMFIYDCTMAQKALEELIARRA